MKKFEMEKIYFPAKGVDPKDDIVENMLRDAPVMLKALIASGCKLDIEVKDDSPAGMRLIVRSRYPVSVLNDSEGNPIHVIENRSGQGT